MTRDQRLQTACVLLQHVIELLAGEIAAAPAECKETPVPLPDDLVSRARAAPHKPSLNHEPRPTARELIRRFFVTHPAPVHIRQIAAKLQMNKSTVSYACTELFAENKLRRIKHGVYAARG